MKKALRILVAYHGSRARNGGLSRTMAFIHDHLISAGHSVDYFCAEDVPPGLGGRFARFSFPVLIRNQAMIAARSGKPYDLINVHEPSAAAISKFRASAGNPVVVVTSFGVERRGWDLALEELKLGREGPSLKSRVVYPLTSLWQSRLGFLRADHIFCKNFEDRDYLLQWLNVPKDKITRFYPGAERIYATEAAKRDYSRYERLLFAGTWLKRKGIEDLIPAFTTLATKHPELKLIVLGAGVPESAVKGAFPESIRSRISYVQSANESENARAFAAADIYLLPSLFEGTPLTLMEAMMSGMPIITTDICGMKDVIKDGKNGLLVPTHSAESIVAAVERLVSNAIYRKQIARTAQDDALSLYTWDRVAVPIQEVYERLCEQRSLRG